MDITKSWKILICCSKIMWYVGMGVESYLRPSGLRVSWGTTIFLGESSGSLRAKKIFLERRVHTSFQYSLFVFVFANSWSQLFGTIRYSTIRQIFTICTSLLQNNRVLLIVFYLVHGHYSLVLGQIEFNLIFWSKFPIGSMTNDSGPCY